MQLSEILHHLAATVFALGDLTLAWSSSVYVRCVCVEVCVCVHTDRIPGMSPKTWK